MIRGEEGRGGEAAMRGSFNSCLPRLENKLEVGGGVGGGGGVRERME